MSELVIAESENFCVFVELFFVVADLVQEKAVEGEKLLAHCQFPEVIIRTIHILNKVPGQIQDTIEVCVLHILRIYDQVKQVNILSHFCVNIRSQFNELHNVFRAAVVVDHDIVQASHLVFVRTFGIIALRNEVVHDLFRLLLCVADVVHEDAGLGLAFRR